MSSRMYQPLWEELKQNFPAIRTIQIECHKDDLLKVRRGLKKEKCRDVDWKYAGFACLRYRVVQTMNDFLLVEFSLHPWRTSNLVGIALRSSD